MLKKLKFMSIATILVVAASFMVGCFGGAGIVVTNMELTNQHNPTPSLTLFFELDNDLDLDDENNNIEIAYFTVEDGEDIAIKNSAENGTDLVKNKGWAGFLVDEQSVQYVKGTVGADDYKEANSNLLKKDVKYATQLRNGASSDGVSMEYHSINWAEEYNFKVVITITTKAGKSQFSETFNHNPNPVV